MGQSRLFNGRANVGDLMVTYALCNIAIVHCTLILMLKKKTRFRPFVCILDTLNYKYKKILNTRKLL